jgi:hypothetical protein
MSSSLRSPEMNAYEKPAIAAPTSGASQNSQSCPSA